MALDLIGERCCGVGRGEMTTKCPLGGAFGVCRALCPVGHGKRGVIVRMMFGLVLIVGLALAGFAVYMVQGYFGQQQAALAQEQELRMKTGNLVEVYVLNKPLGYGDPVTPEDVQKVYWQESALPETIFRDEATLFPVGAKGPRYLMRGMEKFEPLLASRVTEPGEAAGLTGKLGPGLGAFTIRVDASSGLAGLQPEDRVDVYWTGVPPAGGDEVTQLIESAVQIIAVDQDPKVEGQEAMQTVRTVTVSGNRDKIARLAQAQARAGWHCRWWATARSPAMIRSR